MSKPKKRKKAGADYFDDCEVCLFMKKMEEEGRAPTLKETKGAFRKAKEKGAVAGGSVFEEDLKKN